ncbi:MAG: hypothetical protein RL007_2613 [Bacteroidota bacterium]|jgi:hypothetical protein
MIRFLSIFALSLFFISCGEDKPKEKVTVDTPEVVIADSADFISDTIVDASGKQVIIKHDCSILRKRIPADSSLDQLQYDLSELRYCVDSFDFRYVVPNLLTSWLSEERVKGNTKITYGDFKKHLEEFKATESYYLLHVQVTTLDSLRSIPFDAAKLPSMKPTFGKLGMTEPEWNAFSGFARTYPLPQKEVFTWGDMMEAFESYYSQYNESH